MLGKRRTPADNTAYEKRFADLLNYATPVINEYRTDRLYRRTSSLSSPTRRTEARVDGSGEVRFRGFFADYKLAAGEDGGQLGGTFSFDEAREETIGIRLHRGEDPEAPSHRALVGAPGFEPGTSCAQGKRATRLRHAPMKLPLPPSLLPLLDLSARRPPFHCAKHFR